MHNLIPSGAEITKGSLWKAGPDSPPKMLTITFRHSDWAKHSRSCLWQLLQLSKIPSQRAPIIIIQKCNCDDSVSHLLSSWPVVPSQPLAPSVLRLTGLPRPPRELVVLVPWVCAQAQTWNPATPQLEMKLFLLMYLQLTYSLCPLAVVAVVSCSVFKTGFRYPYTAPQYKFFAYSYKPNFTRLRTVFPLQWHIK